MTAVATVTAGAGADTVINQNNRALAPAALFGIRQAGTSGLVLGYYGGQFNGNTIADGAVTLTASSTNYVVAHKTTGAVTAATNTTNWLNTLTYLPLYTFVAGVSTFTIAATSDVRQAYGVPAVWLGGTVTGAINEATPVTLASAATVNIGAAAANSISVTGTTAITAFDTIASGAKRELVFAGALILTYNATSLILPTGSNITTAVGDVADFVSLGSGNWRCVNYQRADGTALSGAPFAGGTLTTSLNEAPTVTVASSSTPAIGAAAGNSISMTGTTTVTGFDTIAAGAFRRVVFAGALVLTHNGTSLILPTAANITTAAGDVAEFLSLGSGNWRCVNYMRASGASLSGSIPINSQSGAYTLLIGDANTCIYHPAADTTARIWTIPANSSVPYPIGTAVTFDNDFGAGAITISIATDTLVLVGASGLTGSRTLASGGQATAIKVTATRWRIAGTGLS